MSGGAAHAVHWQSAFWGVTAIALNTIFQDTESLAKEPTLSRWALRSSPCYCLLDILVTVSEILAKINVHRPSTAIRLVAVRRRGQAHGTITHHEKATSGRVIQVIGFVLALLQAIKLLACRGIPVTKTVGLIYLAFYLIEGLLDWLASQEYPDLPINHPPEQNQGHFWNSMHRTARRWALIPQAVMWLVILYLVSPAPDDKSHVWIFIPTIWLSTPVLMLPLLVLMLFAVFVLLAATFGPSITLVLLYALALSESSRRKTTGRICRTLRLDQKRTELVLMCLSPFVINLRYFVRINYSGIWNALVDIPLDRLVDVYFGRGSRLTEALMIFSVPCVVSTIGHPFLIRFKVLKEEEDRSLLHSGLIVTQLAITMLYYSKMYNEEGTSKPAWTDNLG